MLKFENHPNRKVEYSEVEKQKIIEDLTLVGKDKPVGYISLMKLVGVCGVNVEEFKLELENKGLVVLELSREESSIGGGALYAYDKNALNEVLLSGKSILEQNGWPVEPDEFVRHLNVFAEDPNLYNLIMKAFADTRPPKTKRLSARVG